MRIAVSAITTSRKFCLCINDRIKRGRTGLEEDNTYEAEPNDGISVTEVTSRNVSPGGNANTSRSR